jgi:hypothetical protein
LLETKELHECQRERALKALKEAGASRSPQSAFSRRPPSH